MCVVEISLRWADEDGAGFDYVLGSEMCFLAALNEGGVVIFSSLFLYTPPAIWMEDVRFVLRRGGGKGVVTEDVRCRWVDEPEKGRRIIQIDSITCVVQLMLVFIRALDLVGRGGVCPWIWEGEERVVVFDWWHFG